MNRLQALARAVLARDGETRDCILADMLRPSTLAAPCVMADESDVPGGRLVLRYADPVAGFTVRAHIRATFDGPPAVRVTGRNRHGARDKLESMLPRALLTPWGSHQDERLNRQDGPPPDLPDELA